jgi:hypothetical protein
MRNRQSTRRAEIGREQCSRDAPRAALTTSEVATGIRILSGSRTRKSRESQRESAYASLIDLAREDQDRRLDCGWPYRTGAASVTELESSLELLRDGVLEAVLMACG